MLSCESFEIFEDIFFGEHFLATASIISITVPVHDWPITFLNYKLQFNWIPILFNISMKR